MFVIGKTITKPCRQVKHLSLHNDARLFILQNLVCFYWGDNPCIPHCMLITHTQAHTHIYIHVYIYIYIHTHMHTYNHSNSTSFSIPKAHSSETTLRWTFCFIFLYLRIYISECRHTCTNRCMYGREPTTSRTPRLPNKQGVPYTTRSTIGRRYIFQT